jgi:small-conductance mechanosensitive channel
MDLSNTWKNLIADTRKLWIVLSSVMLVVCVMGSFLTRGSLANRGSMHAKGTATSGDMVDQRPWQTAQTLAPMAVSAEEQNYARDAQRLADHVVDQAFAMALREANSTTKVLTGDALELSKKVTRLQQLVKDDQATVNSLTATAKGTGPAAAEAADDLEVAKAQLGLDNDQLADVQQDLAEKVGDKRGKIQQELAAREAAMKKYDEQVNAGGQTSVVSAKRYGTLYGRLRAWFGSRDRRALLLDAQKEAEGDAAALAADHERRESKMDAQAAASAAAGQTMSRADRLTQIQKLADQRSILGILGDREASQRQLAEVYGKWGAQVKIQHDIVTHMTLVSFSIVALILLIAVSVAMAGRKVIEGSKMENRQKRTLQTIFTLGTQVLALLVILLVVFGPGSPGSLPTILGLVTAGLTVVFQDFILGFMGWFVLMGKNGIRVSDWVEIAGVGGEVAEIGLFRTVLLETGNWTGKGHPTGRQISFGNKYAITGTYFNYSTNGQWMWDEIQVSIPAKEDSYETIEKIQKAVVEETKQDSAIAEAEWRKVTRQRGMSQFSAASPSVDIRPAASGVDIVIRFMTRAGERFEMRNRLFRVLVRLLNRPQESLEGTTAESQNEPVMLKGN